MQAVGLHNQPFKQYQHTGSFLWHRSLFSLFYLTSQHNFALLLEYKSLIVKNMASQVFLVFCFCFCFLPFILSSEFQILFCF